MNLRFLLALLLLLWSINRPMHSQEHQNTASGTTCLPGLVTRLTSALVVRPIVEQRGRKGMGATFSR